MRFFVSYTANLYLIFPQVQSVFGIHRRRNQCLRNLSPMVLVRRFQPRKAFSRHRDGSRRWPAYATLTCLLLVRDPRRGTMLSSSFVITGSYEGNLRIWKVDAKLKSFSLVGTVPIPGVVNSLQLVTAPKSLHRTATWISQDSARPSVKQATSRSEPILVVAAVGQEHRLGRWLKISDSGATNSTHVFLYSATVSS